MKELDIEYLMVIALILVMIGICCGWRFTWSSAMFGCDLNDLETSSLTFDGNGVELILVIFGLPYGGDFTWLFTFMVVTKRLILQGVQILTPMRGKDINTTIENYGD